MTLNRYVVHANGKTAYQNIVTKRSKRPVAAFGEKIWGKKNRRCAKAYGY